MFPHYPILIHVDAGLYYVCAIDFAQLEYSFHPIISLNAETLFIIEIKWKNSKCSDENREGSNLKSSQAFYRYPMIHNDIGCDVTLWNLD